MPPNEEIRKMTPEWCRDSPKELVATIWSSDTMLIDILAGRQHSSQHSYSLEGQHRVGLDRNPVHLRLRRLRVNLLQCAVADSPKGGGGVPMIRG